eukprot:6450389-Alexandrium_andersonii.AAC.1
MALQSSRLCCIVWWKRAGSSLRGHMHGMYTRSSAWAGMVLAQGNRVVLTLRSRVSKAPCGCMVAVHGTISPQAVERVRERMEMSASTQCMGTGFG